MQKLRHLFIHCSDTPPGVWFDGGDITDWHTSPKPDGRGWSQVGYNKLFRLDGTVETLVKTDHDEWVQANEITNGAFGYNNISNHWCLIGGMGSEQNNNFHQAGFTDSQWMALNQEIKEFIAIHPEIKILGHNQVGQKNCPGFWVPDYLTMIGVREKNIIKDKLI